MPRALALWLALALAAWPLAGCERGTAPPAETGAGFLNTAPEVAYVGSAACADCHADYWAGYQEHGMARSMYRMAPEHAIEDFSGVVVHDEQLGFSYTVYARDGRFFQEEYRLGASGRKTHQLIREMEYVVGSGTAARTYLVEENGRYHQLPLTWYTQGGGRWDFSPGYREANARFDRVVPHRCMACHTGVANNGETRPVAFADGKFEGLALGIGCEQCHGPGALHIEKHLAGAEETGYDPTIVNPAHLPLNLRLDVCGQCHLSGTVSLLREGVGPYSFRPGEPLPAYVALFSAEPETPGTIAVISHAERMQQSPCFQQSAAMDCTTCHNPHEGFRQAGPEYFNRTCEGCHVPAALQARMPTPELRAQHAAGALCFDCHMPKVIADDAPHSSFTDHFIRVVRPEDRVRAPAEARAGAPLAAYFERDRQGAEGRVYAAMAEVVHARQRGLREGLAASADRLAEALRAHDGVGEGYFLLGWARLQLRQAAGAVEPLERSLGFERVPERLNALAQAYEATGRPAAQVEPLYREALRLQPALADVRVNYGRFLEAQGRLAEATEAYRAAAAEAPWLAPARYNLGTALLRQGDARGAEEHLAEAVRLQPDDAEALLNLGVLRAGQGEEGAAGDLFARAAAAAPENPNAHANLGTFHLGRGAWDEAARAFERAAQLAPDHPDARAGLAAVALQWGDRAEARRQAEAALRLNPQQPLARQVLGVLGG